MLFNAGHQTLTGERDAAEVGARVPSSTCSRVLFAATVMANETDTVAFLQVKERVLNSGPSRLHVERMGS